MPSYILKITPAAFRDLQKGIDYYNEQQKGLGRKFNNVVKAILTQLKKMPTSGSFIYDTVRYRVLNKFPYIILYEIIDNTTIAIYRIFNTWQDPHWQK